MKPPPDCVNPGHWMDAEEAMSTMVFRRADGTLVYSGKSVAVNDVAVDEKSLDRLLKDGRERQFWLKPIGRPGVPLHKQPEIFPESEVEIHFVDRVANIAEGDVLIVYRTGVAKLVYVAERLSESRWTTPPELRSEENQLRYPWFFKAKNLTPVYGARWSEFSLKPFLVAKEFNPLHLDEPASLGALNWHKDRVLIPFWFAELLIRRIQEIA